MPAYSSAPHANQYAAKPKWERACPRIRRISQRMYRLIQRIRKQARSHTLRSSSLEAGYLSLNSGARLATNAAIPSF
ncbi:hypothetical protein C7U57_21475 [Pseudomonas sp. R9.37]|nr:hypothetical protein C7U57_21475 [Pseudomonas sp. R9.37]